MGGATSEERGRPPVLVVLAAGASRRLGTCKALAVLRDAEPRTPLACLLSAGAALGSERALVVTGADHDLVVAAAPAEALLLRNERWSEGRTGSVRRAAREVPGRDLCIAPVDVPLVPAGVFRALGEAWESAGRPARGWLAPWFPGPDGGRRHGHPVLVGRELARELGDMPRDRPLSRLRDLARPLLDVEVADGSILDDLDGPEDLSRLRRRLAPTEQEKER